MSEKIIPTMCHGCYYGGYNCGILAHVKNDKFIKVEGNPYHPLNKGRLCAKGLSAVQWVYNPHRLLYPLKRTGDKGKGEFKRITWNEALDNICEKLLSIKEKYGPEYIIFIKGQASGWFNLYHQLFVRFLHALGSPNFSWWSPSVCFVPQLFYHACTVGGDRYATADYENSDLIIEWFTSGGKGGAARGGPESGNSNLRTSPIQVIDRIQNGAKLIIINPKLISLGANTRAYKWIPIKPGTDSALALAMINVIIEKGLYDHNFVETWCHGFQELADHIKKYPPKWAENITGIPSKEIETLAVEYATTPNACIRVTEAPQKKDLPSFGRAISILIAITGHLDRAGGNVFFYSPVHLKINTFSRRIPKEIWAKTLGADRLFSKIMGGPAIVGADFFSTVKALTTGKPYKPKAAIIVCTNPINTARGTHHIKQALANLEFTVVVDLSYTPTARYADIVLPAATKYEHEADAGIWFNHLATCNKIIEPLGEARSELEIFMDLAIKMGMGKDFWDGNYFSMMNEYLSPAKITIDELKKNSLKGIYLPESDLMNTKERYEKLFLRLPKNKVQLYNKIFEKYDLDPLPVYHGEPEDPHNSPDIYKEFPLIFTDIHSDYFNHHSWMRSIPWLREIKKDPFIIIHPNTAQKYGVEQGDWVKIESPHGSIKAKCIIYNGIRPDTVMGQHGWWQGCNSLNIEEFSCEQEGVNVNVLYSIENRESVTGDITKNTLVRIMKTSPPAPVSPWIVKGEK